MNSPDFIDHFKELLRPLGVPRVKRMFGGHGVYVDELFIAIVTSEQVYLKTDAHTRATFEGAAGQPFCYHAKGTPTTTSYWTVPAQALESPAEMLPWARLALDAALRARAAKPRSPARKPAAAAPAARAKARKGQTEP